MLQPIEQLRDCNAKAEESIDLNYSSLPPQLVVFKAFYARHFVLAAVCTMAMLANLLAVAFSGLFYHATVEVRRPSVFYPPLEGTFVSINGSVGPGGGGSYTTPTPSNSGAYQGGTGKDQFYVAESNYTRGTPLTPWTDDRLFYIPFMPEFSDGPKGEEYYEAETTALGAELVCSVVEHGNDLQVGLAKGVNTTITVGGVKAECTATPGNEEPRVGPRMGEGEPQLCQRGDVAMELTYNLEARSANASLAEQEICWGAAVFGWIRNSEGSCNQTSEVVLDASNSFFVQCQSRLVLGRGNVAVDAVGRLVKKANLLPRTLTNDEAGSMFSNAPSNLIGQANMFIFQWVRPAWHNDSFTSDYINYFASRAVNDSRLSDPKQGLPTLSEVQVPLSKAYSGLFAIWLGLNKDQLLLPRASGSTISASGWKITMKERLFLSVPLFAIAEGILAMYAVVAIIVYLRRPGRYLPRLPTSIASVVGLFAAGGAVRDMRGTSHLDSKERANHLEKLDDRYGYGNYVGVDGMIHVGIEKTPFVRLRTETQRRK